MMAEYLMFSWFEECIHPPSSVARVRNILGLPKSRVGIESSASTRRTGLCWEATRAPRWTRIPQAWAALAAQAGLLRVRPQSDKSQGVRGTASPAAAGL